MDKKIAYKINGYQPFSQSPIWDMRRAHVQSNCTDSWIHAHISHAEIARRYAQIVLGFWRDLKNKNSSIKQPLYIIELDSGTGRFAYHFLIYFFRQFDAIREPNDQVCYIMADSMGENIDVWRRHEKFSNFIKQGRLDFATYNLEKENTLTLTEKNITLKHGSLKLPPVIIANDCLSTLRQDLFYLEKEKIYDGWLALKDKENYSHADKDNPFAKLTLSYQKRPLQETHYPHPEWLDLIKQYAQSLPSCAVLFPSHALKLFAALRKLHGEEMLLLSADRGSNQLKPFVVHKKPHITVDGRFSLPVNYDAISQLVRISGGNAWQSQSQEGLAVLAAIYGTSSYWPETQITAQTIFSQFNPDDTYQLKLSLEEYAGSLTREQMLAHLRLSHWDTKVFYVFLPYLQLAGLPKAQQNTWEKALNEVWRNHIPVGEEYDLAFDLGILAANMHRWQNAISLFQESVHYGLALSACYYNLGIAHWQLGQHDDAEQQLRKALAFRKEEHRVSTNRNIPEDDQHLNIEEQLISLMAWRHQCKLILGEDTLALISPAHSYSHTIYATLLGQHHAQALYSQQRDISLAEQVGIDVINNISHAREWIEDLYNSQKIPLAIFDPNYGLVGLMVLETPIKPAYKEEGGATPLHPRTNTARFYYWVGRQHQNQGYATQALALLHQFAIDRGITHIFSTIDVNNHASQRVAKKLGYQRLDFEFKKPWLNDENLTYYQKVLVEDGITNNAELYRTLGVYLKDFSTELELKPRPDLFNNTSTTITHKKEGVLRKKVIPLNNLGIDEYKK